MFTVVKDGEAGGKLSFFEDRENDVERSSELLCRCMYYGCVQSFANFSFFIFYGFSYNFLKSR